MISRHRGRQRDTEVSSATDIRRSHEKLAFITARAGKELNCAGGTAETSANVRAADIPGWTEHGGCDGRGRLIVIRVRVKGNTEEVVREDGILADLVSDRARIEQGDAFVGVRGNNVACANRAST